MMPGPEIQIEMVPRRRPGRWSTRLAFRATLMAAMALAAAYIVQTKALPTLNHETSDSLDRLPAGTRWIIGLRDHLMLLPIPALALGIAAIALRPLRPVLAPLATIAAILAVVAIVGALIVGLIPLYQVPADMAVGR